jgi:hypothetical protein
MWLWLSSGMLNYVVWLLLTDVSEELGAFVAPKDSRLYTRGCENLRSKKIH